MEEPTKWTMKIACIGAGYVGGPTCAVIAEKCHDILITIVDINQKRIDDWNSDSLPIYEPGLEEIVKLRRGKNLFFSTDVDGAILSADIIFVCVNTPTKKTGTIGGGSAADLTFIESATRRIAAVAKSNKIVVEKSTVPCRTADSMHAIFKANSLGGYRFDVLSNPEFLAEGTAINDLLQPDRILIGCIDDPLSKVAQDKLASVYENWVSKEKIIKSNLWSSELSKLAANAMLAQRISSINALSALCEVTGANIDEVSHAVGCDTRIGNRFLKASIGFGGSCFQKDILNLIYLCESLNLRDVAEYWKGVININEYQKRRFTHKVVEKMFNTVSGKKVAIFGFAFKKNTGDTRESPAITVVELLTNEGAHVRVYDPKVKDEDLWMELDRLNCDPQRKYVTTHRDMYSAAEGCDAIVVCTEWDEFKEADYSKIYESMKKPAFIFDGRLILDQKALRDIGFNVTTIGK